MIQKQIVPVTLQGLDKKSDEKVLVPGKLTRLDNCRVKNLPTVEKRYGYTTLGTVSASSIFTLNNELLSIESGTLYSWSPASNAWLSKGIANTSSTDVQYLLTGQSTHQAQEYAEVDSKISVCAYLDSSSNIIIFTKDLSSGAYILPPTSTSIASTAGNLRLVTVGSTWWLVIRTTSKIKVLCGQADGASYTNVEHKTDAAAKPIDAAVYGANLVVVYQTATVANIFTVSTANVIGTPGIGLPATTALDIVWDEAVCVVGNTDLTGGPVTVFGTDGTAFKAQTLTAGFTQYASVGTVSATLTVAAVRIAAVQATATTYHFFYDNAGGTKEATVIHGATYTVSTALGTQAVLTRGSLLAQPQRTDSKTIIHTLYDSDTALQSSVFHFTWDGSTLTMCGRSLPAVAAPRIIHVHKSDADNIFSCGSVVRQGVTNTVRVQFTLESVPVTLDVLNTLYISGSILQQYDGVSTVEQGFLLFPEKPTNTTATTGGYLTNGVYLISCVYEWTDANGDLQRSAPSSPLSVTLSGGTNTEKITLTVQTLWHTLKRDTIVSPVIIRTYRTVAGGTVYYEATATPTTNSLSAASVSVVLTQADATIQSQALLYTTGGVFENIPPPSNTIIAKYKDRVVVAGGECGTKLFWSKPKVSLTAAEFSDLLYKDLLSEKEPTALQEMDDTLVVFTEDRTSILAGEPPNALGANSTLSTPQLLPSNVGSITPFVATMPNGLVFQSKNGIWTLDRGRATSYIGAQVEGLPGTLTSATLIPNEQAILLTSDTGTLVYDYFFNLWSQYDLPAIGACIYNNTHTILSTEGSVRNQGTTYGDDGAPYETDIETGWLSLAGVNGYQRILNITFLGAHKGPCKFVVDVKYDFSETVIDTYQFDTTVLQGTTYGEDTPYGTGTYGGTSDGVLRLKMKPSRQKCTSIKIHIRDEFPLSAPTGGFSITTIQFECGVIKGRANMAKANNIIVR